jgi:hypothetical protein
MLFVVIRLNEKIMRVLVQSALVGAPKNTTKIILIPMQVAGGFLQP